MFKFLITGINGFAASWLAKYLITNYPDAEVYGTVRQRSDLYRLDKLNIKNKLHLHLTELTDPYSISEIIKKVKPTHLYHLAAQNFVKFSWDAPHETFNINVQGTIHILESIRIYCPGCKVLITSSSEVYGQIDGLIFEGTEPRPRNPYAASKLAQEQITRVYCEGYNIPYVITRSFNITGWGRNDVYVDSNFARQVVEIEKGIKKPIIYHGNLEAKRTFYDVRDAVRAYDIVMMANNIGEIYNIGKQGSNSIQEILDLLIINSTSIKQEYLDNNRHTNNRDIIKTVLDKSRLRPTDTMDMHCNANKIRNELGWQPVYNLEQSLVELLRYWRERL